MRITCIDEQGNVLKRVTSGDSGDIEDPEAEGGSTGGNASGPSAEG